MATADLGAIAIGGLLSFSPLIDLLRACIARLILATVRAEETESRLGLASDIFPHGAAQRHTHNNRYYKHHEDEERGKGRGRGNKEINGAPSSSYKLCVGAINILCSDQPW